MDIIGYGYRYGYGIAMSSAHVFDDFGTSVQRVFSDFQDMFGLSRLPYVNTQYETCQTKLIPFMF